MGDFLRPSKKLRLDETNGDFDWDFAGNDDLWGQDEITAEEFDLLEVQATQAISQKNDLLNENQLGQPSSSNAGQSPNVGQPGTSNLNKPNQLGQTSTLNVYQNYANKNPELDRLKQEQYALEGKNKALTDMLEKTRKELTDERLNREQIITQKLITYKQKEADLSSEIDKLQTVLQFTEQDVRAERSKTCMVEHKLKEKIKELQLQKESNCHGTHVKHFPAKKSPVKILNWNSFDTRDEAKTHETGIQTESLRCRRFPLSLQAPKGEPQGTDAVCKLLTCRIIDPFFKRVPLFSSEGDTNSVNDIFRRARDSSSISVAMLRHVKESDSVWKPYETALQEYITRLRIERSSWKLASKKMRLHIVEDKRHCDLNSVQSGILNCLKDLSRLLFHQCPEERCDPKFEKKNDIETYSVHSEVIVAGDDDVMQSRCHRLAELLVTLANPTTYPSNYKKTYEIEWALAALVAWSSHSTKSLESCIRYFPLHSLVSGQQGMECAYLALKLMVPLIGLGSFREALVHHSDSCILCSTGSLCKSFHGGSTGSPSCLFIDTIENFLSGVLTCYGFAVIERNSYPCSSQVIQGFIVMLVKKLQCPEECNLPYQLSVMKKGVILLYFIATNLPSFVERCKAVEKHYAALICGLSKLCKENLEFKISQGMIRELWDFQDDYSEFEAEEVHSTQLL